jgi:hypothetical protein
MNPSFSAKPPLIQMESPNAYDESEICYKAYKLKSGELVSALRE